MNNGIEIQEVFDTVLTFAQKNRNRYLTPEHLLYGICCNEIFQNVFQSFGGNIEKLKHDLETYIEDNAETIEEDETIEPTNDFEKVFRHSLILSIASGHETNGIPQLLSAILQLKDSFAAYSFFSQGIDEVELLGVLSREFLKLPDHKTSSMPHYEENALIKVQNDNKNNPDDKIEDVPKKIKKNSQEDWLEDTTWDDLFLNLWDSDVPSFDDEEDDEWRDYVENMSETCKNKKPLIGRAEELERTIQILCRMDKNNVIYIGEAGVGKTAIAYGLAQKILAKEVPEPLQNCAMYGLETATLMADTSYRGEFEERLKKILDGVLREKTQPIIYIDEIHNIVGAGAVEDSNIDMSNILKPYLADGRIRFIGATTYQEYKRYFSKNSSLLRRFQNIDVKEPSEAETIAILNGLKGRYEKFHGVKYGKGVIEYAVSVSKKYINDRYLPDKAIDLIDEAGAYRRLHPLNQKTQSIQKSLIDDILSKTCNIPKQMVEQDDIEKLFSLEQNFSKLIFGQQEAVEQVLNAVKFAKAGLNDENKPMASLLFVGPTGVGKTEVAKTLANQLGIGLIRFDMSEYGEKHAVAKLIGSPAGYVGYEDGGLLTDAVRKQPHAVLLLDEIEKAHPDIYHILLQVMDYATLSDNQGRKADFRNIILIMTSNAGASMATKSGMGFGNSMHTNTGAIMEAVKHTFQPEFRNRLTKIVTFQAMDDEMALNITRKKLGELTKQLEKKKIELQITESAVVWIKQAGITNEYGAREIDRVISGKVKPLLVNEMLFGHLKNGGQAMIDVVDNKLCLTKLKK
ncbi:MAG: AAA family ATPase [Lachnospiraceae bacterium]